jgi:hypothetical protein
MAYEAGTSSGTLQFTTYDPDAGFSASGGKTSNQTFLAQKVQPPVRPEWTFGEVFAVPFLAAIAFIIAASLNNAVLGIFLGLTVGSLMWYVINRRVSQKKPIYEKELSKWARSWICLRCGMTWLMRKH